MKRKRTTAVKRFFSENQRLLFLLLLPLLGCVGGMVLYGSVCSAEWAQLLVIRRIPSGFGQVMLQFFASCFQPLVLLFLLFVAGLSACGLPVAVVVPLFWGVGFGLTLATCYTNGWGGVALSAVVLLPRSVMEAVALLMAASECLHMSLRFTALLLPRSAHCGGLWQEFRLYGLRFVVLVLLLFLAGALDVGMRLLCVNWLL